MPFARSLMLAGCFAVVVCGGCYRSADKVADKSGSGSSSKPAAPSPVIVHGTDIADDRNSKHLQMVTVEQLREEERKRAEASAAAEAAANPTLKPAVGPTATAPLAAASTGTAPQSTSTPSATASGTPKVAARPSATFDPYVRPAAQRDPTLAAVEVRPSRSPPPKKAQPPVDRTKVLAAPPTTSGVLGITFDDLMFDMKPTDIFDPKMINDAVRALFGKKVKLRGYINPVSAMSETGLTQFVFVRDDQACCFGPGALLYDNVVVKMKPGKTANFSIRPIAVEGTLSFHETGKFGNQPLSIFQIDADSAE